MNARSHSAILSIALSIGLFVSGCTRQPAGANTSTQPISPATPPLTPTIPYTETPVEPTIYATSTFAPTFTPIPSATTTSTPFPTPTQAFINSDNASLLTSFYTLPKLGGFDSLFFTPTGVYTATVAGDGSIQTIKIDEHVFQEINQGQTWALNNKDLTKGFNGFAGPNGKLYAAQFKGSKGHGVKLWRLSNTLEYKMSLDFPTSFTNSWWSFAISPDENYIVCISASEPELICDSKLCYKFHIGYTSSSGFLYGINEGAQIVYPLQGFNNSVNFFPSPQFSPDNRFVAAISGTSSAGLVQVWKVADGSLYKHMALPTPPYMFRDIAFSPDSNSLAILDGAKIILWEFQNQKIRWTITGDFQTIQFSPDGTLLASGSEDGYIKFWNASDGKLLATLAAHPDVVTTLAFSPDGLILASVSQDGTGKLWKIGEGK